MDDPVAAELSGRSAMTSEMWTELEGVSTWPPWADLREGAGIVRFFERHYRNTPGGSERQVRLLDVGSGNGGVVLAAANCRRYDAMALDIVVNNDLIRCKGLLGVPMQAMVGSGDRLPFADETFDIVLLLDMIEHVSRPGLLGREVMRVLAPGGVSILTTPPPAKVCASARPALWNPRNCFVSE